MECRVDLSWQEIMNRGTYITKHVTETLFQFNFE